jgi:hypothetical protein
MSFISVGDGTIVNSAHIVVIVPNKVTGGCDIVMDDGRTLRDTRTAEQLAKKLSTTHKCAADIFDEVTNRRLPKPSMLPLRMTS